MYLENAEELFKILSEINSNNIRSLQMYGNFLKDVIHDESSGAKLLEKADYIIKSSLVNK